MSTFFSYSDNAKEDGSPLARILGQIVSLREEIMSFDVFVGLPPKRLLWAKDVVDYYDAETDWDAHDEQPRDLILPAISQFALELGKEWPPLDPAGPFNHGASDDHVENERLASYGFGPTSVYLCFSWSMQAEAHEKVRALAIRHNLLFFNCSGWDWINAARNPAYGRAGTISVFESKTPGSSSQWHGMIPWIELGDADLLTAADRFDPDFYFNCALSPDHYMQVCNSGEHYIIEFRDGSPDQHYRAETPSLEKIRESLNLFFSDNRRALQLLDYQRIRV